MTPNPLVSLGDAELLNSTRALVGQSNLIEADLLAHLSEVEQRRLHLERAFPSMFEYCVEDLGMSESIAANRIYVARLVRQLPLALEWVRSGRIHLSGLRVLAPHLNETNCEALLGEAEGMSKRDIEILVTRFAPKPIVADSLRQLPSRPAPTVVSTFSAPNTPAPPLDFTPSPRPRIEPLTPTAFKLTLVIDGALRDKVKQAEDLMRHRVRRGDLAAIVEEALDVLIEKVKKERFGVGRKPRTAAPDPTPGEGPEGSPHVSRHVPDAIKREVYERDGGRCSFVRDDGKRCSETGGLELEHLDGFAITREHSVPRITLRCGPHNRHAAEKVYGREKLERLKATARSACPGTCEQELLF